MWWVELKQLFLDHEVETKSWKWQNIKIEGACDTRDSKVTIVVLIAYIYVREKLYFIYEPVGFFFFFGLNSYPTATFQLNLILTD